MTWAQRQRQIFLRQRQERALSYAQSGVPVRPAYALAASASLAASGQIGEEEDWGGDQAVAASLQQATALNASRPCTTGSIGSYVPRWGSSAQKEDGVEGGWGTHRVGEGIQGAGTSICLPKPTCRKVRILGNSW